jgi:mutator protein MutT
MSEPEVALGEIPVVAAVLRRGGKVLIARRPAGKRHGGMWEFPGGKVFGGESLLDAVRRELAEELVLEVRGIGDLLFRADDPGSPFSIHFVEVFAEGLPRAIEHSEFAWVTPDELPAFLLAPADARFVREGLAFPAPSPPSASKSAGKSA